MALRAGGTARRHCYGGNVRLNNGRVNEVSVTSYLLNSTPLETRLDARSGRA